MREYQPLDISAFCQSNVRPLISNQELPHGERPYHGLPFRLGGQDGRVLGLGDGLGIDPVTLPVGETARYVVFAHRLIDSKIEHGDPVGRVCADYQFLFDDGEIVSVPIRERLEIGIIPFPWGQVAMLCHPDAKDYLSPRYHGEWARAGRRRAEAFEGWPEYFYLYAWPNPRPDRPIESIILAPRGPRFFVLGVTLGHLEEYPFNRHAKLDVKLTLEQRDDADRPFDLAVEVDRGVATFPFPLPRESTEEFLKDPFAGFGQEQNPKRSPAYTQIAANPSATVSVKQGEELVGSVRWSEVLERGSVTVDSRLRIELVDKGRNWVHTTVVDDETNQPIPCRIHFRSPDGIPYQPHGYHQHVNSDLESWIVGNSADMKLGQATYAYISGKCQGWLPRGEVVVDIARGFEYEPLRTKLELKAGQRELTFRLKRFRNMNRERYFSGDTHVHCLSTQGAHLEAAGEDLNVVNLLQSQWGHLFTDTMEFTGRPSVAPDGKTIVYATQENRQHILGHLILLGVKDPIMPWCTDGPSEAELGGNLETTTSRWADACHDQGGTVVLPHMPNPNCEPAVLVVTGRVDAMEMCVQDNYSIGEYYKYLNCGYRMPLTGGTDKMSSDVPVGLYRTYVHIPADEPFNYETWCKHLRLGNTFLSAGPLMSFSVEGRPIGSTLELPGNGGELEVEASAESALPFYCLELVVNGSVVARTEEARPARRLRLRERIRIDKHSWIAARCAGPSFSVVKHHDGWRRGVMAHTSPIYVAVGGPWWMFDVKTAEYLLTLVHGGLDYIKHRSTQWPPGSVTHHHRGADHMQYLEEPFQSAIRILHQRMHEHGIPH